MQRKDLFFTFLCLVFSVLIALTCLLNMMYFCRLLLFFVSLLNLHRTYISIIIPRHGEAY